DESEKGRGDLVERTEALQRRAQPGQDHDDQEEREKDPVELDEPVRLETPHRSVKEREVSRRRDKGVPAETPVAGIGEEPEVLAQSAERKNREEDEKNPNL